MRLLELALVYVLVGIGCALAVARRREGRHRLLDAGLVAAFWPLHAPFVFGAGEPSAGSGPSPIGDEEARFLDALERAAETPLGTLLPGRAQASALADRLRRAHGRVREIDRLLEDPDFSEDAARQRLDGLGPEADPRARAAVQSRLRNLRRLRQLRDRFRGELEAIAETCTQLRIQAEVVRLAGELDADSRDLVGELLCRVEGLDAVLDDDSPTTDP